MLYVFLYKTSIILFSDYFSFNGNEVPWQLVCGSPASDDISEGFDV